MLFPFSAKHRVILVDGIPVAEQPSEPSEHPSNFVVHGTEDFMSPRTALAKKRQAAAATARPLTPT